MTTTPPLTPEDLRQRAEELFLASESLIPEYTSPEETKQLIHELRVHQIQLEMQNEELRQTQANLDASQARYFDLYDLAPVGYLTLTEKRIIREINLATANMFGISRNSLVREPISSVLPKEDQYLFYQHLKQCKESGVQQLWDMRLVRADGSEFWAHLQATYAQNGEFWLVLTDISERKLAEEKLASSERFLQAIIDTEPECIKMLDSDGNLLMMNQAGLNMIDADSFEQVKGQCVHPLIAESCRDAFITLTKQVFQGIPGVLEFETIGLKGRHVWLGTHAVPFCNDRGEIVSLLGITRDITARKLADDELHHAKAAAETANIAKSQFLSNMSHEIRIPMNGVLGMVQLLQHSELTSEQREYTEIALSSGKKLVELLNNILDLAKIEAGKVELEIADFDLTSMVSDTINILSLQTREKGLILTSSQDNDVPLALKGDAGRLRQIIINLVGNAIKFTPTGAINLHIQKVSDNPHSANLCFLVRDSGIGIATDKLEHIFNPFTQADGSTTRTYGGTGLGLAICKQLVELMGGTIGVESSDGGGSTFRFTVELQKQVHTSLPLSPIMEEACREPFSAIGIRILLTEDDPVAQKIVSRLLNSFGYLVDVVCDGKEAVDALKKNLNRSNRALVFSV